MLERSRIGKLVGGVLLAGGAAAAFWAGVLCEPEPLGRRAVIIVGSLAIMAFGSYVLGGPATTLAASTIVGLATTQNATPTQVERLRAAVADSRTLIEFAVVSNRRLEDKVIDDLMARISALGDLTVSQTVALDKEGDFWKAYQNLTQAILPVTATSIQQSTWAAAKPWGATSKHATIAAVLFLVLIVTQAIWVVGTTLRTDLDKSEKAIVELEKERRPVDTELRQRAAAIARLKGDDPKAKLDSSAAIKMRDLQDQALGLQQRLGALDRDLSVLRDQRDPVVELISRWYRWIAFGRGDLAADQEIKDLKTKLAAEQAKKEEGGGLFAVFKYAVGGGSARAGAIEREIAQRSDQRVVELKRRADLILDILQRYLFPVLLGLLGALTYILRNLIVQIREYSYTANFPSLSLVRISLGMMAGLLGGLLIPQSDTVLKTLTPLGLSFLFGYAVEVVFAFLDRIVKAFVEDRAVAK